MPELERLHKQHGPVVRIGPNELHINSPEFVYEIYKPGYRYIRDKYHYDMICLPNALPGIVDPTVLRVRREAIHPLFKKKAVIEYWPQLCKKIDKLIAKLCEQREPVVVLNALSCFTLDVISEMTFSQDFRALDTPGFRHYFQSLARDSQRSLWFMKFFPRIRGLAMKLAPFLTTLNKNDPIAKFRNAVQKMIDDYDANVAGSEKVVDGERHHCIIEHLKSDNAARKWVAFDRETLTMESAAILAGGTETAAMAGMLGIYHILTNPVIHRRLVQELYEQMPDRDSQLTLSDYEQLPYLTAVIREIIRYSNPVPGRLPRIVPEGGAIVDGAFIPAGTAVGMSAYLTHRVENLFPDGDTFNPDRWLERSSSNLDDYILTFSKGSGRCPGVNLAWAELYLMIGTLFRRCEITLAKNTSPDCLLWSDHVVRLVEGPELQATFRLCEASQKQVF